MNLIQFLAFILTRNGPSSFFRPSRSLTASHAVVACASVQCTLPSPQVVSVTDDYGVRCCSESQFAGSVFTGGSCNLWTSSKDSSGTCLRSVDYATAFNTCASYGADVRLCTEDENSRNCSKGARCQLNTQLVWSSDPLPPTEAPSSSPTIATPAPTGTPTETVTVVGVASIACASVQCSIVPSPQTKPVTDEYGARCCSDTPLPDFVFTGGSCNLYSYARDASGACMTDVTYNYAKSTCESYGARLCTVEENVNNCSKASRCGLNSQQIWVWSEILPTNEPSALPSLSPTVAFSAEPSVAATPEPTTTLSEAPSVVASAAPSVAVTPSPTVEATAGIAAVACASVQCTEVPNPQIVPTGETYGARCCSDNALPDFVYTGGSCDLWSYARDADGACMTDVKYHDAKSTCESYGARLCTVEENSNNCSKASRCGLNSEQIWVWSEILPTNEPSVLPSLSPSVAASALPSVVASDMPSVVASASPSVAASAEPSVAASSPPTVVSSPAPSVEASLAPSVLASSVPSLEETATHAVAACASVQCTTVPSSGVFPVSDSFGVRCCSESEFLGSVYTGGSCDLWSSSENLSGQCVTSATYYEAKAVCALYGSGVRLCTSEENSNNCSKAARCKLNGVFVWTSDPIPPSEAPSSYPSAEPSVAISDEPSVAASAEPSVVASAAPSVTVSLLPTAEATTGVAAVACASVQCTIVPSPQIVPTDEAFGARCCSDTPLPDFVFTGGSCNLYSYARDADGACMTDVKYHEAKSTCEAYGARLCTVEENVNNCSKASRCGLNSEQIWVWSDILPTNKPSALPSLSPTVAFSAEPSVAASAPPSVAVSAEPSVVASASPSVAASAEPSVAASAEPSVAASAEPSVEASASPSVAASAEPSVEASVAPTVSATDAPTLAIAAIACASIQCTIVPSPKNVPSTELFGARCCSETPFASAVFTGGSCNLYSYARDPSDTCMTDVNYNYAKTTCESYGARLCTVEENSNNCSKASRCGLNTDQVWVWSDILPTNEPSALPSLSPTLVVSQVPSAAHSSVPTALPSNAPVFAPSAIPSLVTSSAPSATASVPPTLLPTETVTSDTALVSCASVQCTASPSVEEVPKTSLYGARCCSSTPIPDFIHSTVGVCDVYVYGLDLDGNCMKQVTYKYALDACEGLGARLCTVTENADNCTKPARCGLNKVQVWSGFESLEPSAVPSIEPSAEPSSEPSAF